MSFSKLFHLMPQWHGCQMPLLFTYPFAYRPNRYDEEAASVVRRHILSVGGWHEELQRGKMFGVLIVEHTDGQRGFLTAFSGTLGGRLRQEGFVPPLLDYEREDGIFRLEERAISAINAEIIRRGNDTSYTEKKTLLAKEELMAAEAVEKAKNEYKRHKAERAVRRASQGDPDGRLEKESQFEKAEIRRLSRKWDERLAALRCYIATEETAIETLRQERRRRSEILQRWLFSRMRIHSYAKETKTVWDVFHEAQRGIPPSGTGECAAPRLLDYAICHNYKIYSMAEFWVGRSPKGEIRVDGQFYPACHTKCGPLLAHILDGVPLMPNPLTAAGHDVVDIVYEDEWIIVANKPAGLPTVGDDSCADTLMKRLLRLRPTIEAPGYTHRLDQATSGLVVVAKDRMSHEFIRRQFENRETRKRYTAVVDGTPEEDKGTIRLPICANVADRPRQIVDTTYGKETITRYEVAEKSNGRTRVFFYPLTGRTHQLRVHAAHPDGLHCPIVGDNLYGTLDSRLMLHADTIEFTHPNSHQKVRFHSPAPF